jgi:septal ring-binding cell division protein DamX
MSCTIHRCSSLMVLLTAAFSVVFCWGREERKEEKAKLADSLAVAVQTQNLTYLDTLNKGREVRIAAPQAIPPAAAVQPVQIAPTPRGSTEIDGFRVQCFASSSVDAVRTEKKTVEAKTLYPVYISFEQPFYRLHLGNFPTRPEAEVALAELRAAGYADAWIVRAKIVPPSR